LIGKNNSKKNCHEFLILLILEALKDVGKRYGTYEPTDHRHI